MDPKPVSRVYYLDWLRVIGILAVFIFHSTRFFDTGNWHVKSLATFFSVNVLQEFMLSWMMPLMFLISGASLFFSMRKGSSQGFFKDKFLRLGVPLLVGVFTHASLQVYLERITHGQFQGNFFQFLPHYFDGIYIDIGSPGNFAIFGMHLWYLAILYLYIALLHPLFAWFLGGGRRWLDRLGNLLTIPGIAYLLWLPTILLFSLTEEIPAPGGWPLPVYILFVLVGFIFAAQPRFQAAVLRLRWVSLIGATLLLAVHLALMTRPATYALFDEINSVLFSAIVWFALFASLGFGMRYLNASTPFLKYASEAVLPFYILHQTVLLVVGYLVLQGSLPPALQWLVIACTSFISILLIYEFLVRRSNLLRFLFGMKPLSSSGALSRAATLSRCADEAPPVAVKDPS